MNSIEKCLVENKTDANGNSAGGQVVGVGLLIRWQDGPLGRGAERQEPNGAFVETVIAAAQQRLAHYQAGKFACPENETALQLLTGALAVLNQRTADRGARGVEGTHEA